MMKQVFTFYHFYITTSQIFRKPRLDFNTKTAPFACKLHHLMDCPYSTLHATLPSSYLVTSLVWIIRFSLSFLIYMRQGTVVSLSLGSEIVFPKSTDNR